MSGLDTGLGDGGLIPSSSPFTESHSPVRSIETPEYKTGRQLQREMITRVDPSIGFWGTIGHALATETVAGEFIRWLETPNFESTGYVPTKKDLQEYASDLPQEVLERVIDETDSFPGFLFELDQARISIRRRKEIYSGGTMGAVGGFAASMLAMGGEAVAMTLLLGAALPAGGAAALGLRGSGTMFKASTGARRMAGAGKAALGNLVVDIPLEAARYELDKTMTPTDLIIGLSASAGLGGAIGAWKPHIYLDLKHQIAERAAKLKAAKEGGDDAAAEAVEAEARIRVTPNSEDAEDLASMPRGYDSDEPGSLLAEAKVRNVETTKTTEVVEEVDLTPGLAGTDWDVAAPRMAVSRKKIPEGSSPVDFVKQRAGRSTKLGDELPTELGGTVTAGSKSDVLYHRSLLNEQSPALLQRMDAWVKTFLGTTKYKRAKLSVSASDATKGFTPEEAQLAKEYAEAVKRRTAQLDIDEGGVPLNRRASIEQELDESVTGARATLTKNKTVNKTVKELRAELLEKRRAAKDEAIGKQVDRDLDKLDEAAIAREARRLGVSERTIKVGGQGLKDALRKASIKTASTGTATVQRLPSLPGTKSSATVSVKPRSKPAVKVTFVGKLEHALWKIAKSRNNGQTKLVESLKAAGVENPEVLALAFAAKVEKLVGRSLRENWEKPVIADFKELADGKWARKLDDGTVFKPKKGEHLFDVTTKQDIGVEADLFPNSNVRVKNVSNKAEADELRELPMSAEPETLVTSADGQTVTVVPGSAFGSVAYETGAVARRGLDTVQGGREKAAMAIDSLEAFMRHFAPDTKWLQSIGRGFDRIFTGITSRVLGGETELMRRFVRTFLDDPMSGSHSVTSMIRANADVAISKLQWTYKKAAMAAAEEGQKFVDLDVVRAVRSGLTHEELVVHQDYGRFVADAAEGVRDFYKSVLKHGKEGGVFTGSIPDDIAYFHRQWSPTKLEDWLQKNFAGNYKKGQEAVRGLIKAAIKKKNDAAKALTDGQMNSMSARIFEYMSDRTAKRDWESTRSMVSKMKETLTEEFTADAAKQGKVVTGEAGEVLGKEIARDVDDFIDMIVPRMDGSNPHISYGRPRIGLDESHKGSVTLADGTKMEVHIDEFMDNDILANTRRYAQKVLGGVEMRKGVKAVFGDADTSYADIEKQIRQAAREAGEDHKVDFYLRVASHTYRSLTGQQLYNKGAMKWAAGVSALNHSTLGMTLGFAQIPEMANILARTGWKAAWQQFEFSDIRKVFLMGLRDAKNKRKTGQVGMGLMDDADDLSSTLETWTGMAGDYGRNDHFMHRMDEIGFDSDYVSKARFMQGLEKGRQFASLNPLGIMPMDTFMRRWASRASFQHFVNTAYKIDEKGIAVLSDTWWSQSKKRFAQIGMSVEDVEKISKVLRDPDLIEYQGGVLGPHKVKNLLLDKVKPEDQAIVNKFVLSLRKHTDSMIQRQTYGETPEWVNTNIGKFISQFRVFSIVAKSKQLAQGVARADAVEAGNIVGAGALGILAYTTMSYYKALGQENPEEWFAERMDADHLIRGGVSRMGMTTILPMLLDPIAKMTTGQALFNKQMRSTGQAMGPLEGSTAWSAMERVKDTALGVIPQTLFRDAASTENLSSYEARNAQSLIWLLKIPGIDQLINSQYISPLDSRNN